MTKFQPHSNRLLIKRKEAATKSQSGLLHIPDNAQQKSFEGEVLAAGPGCRLESGDLLPMTVKAGDVVMFPAHAYDEIKLDGENYILISEDNILGIVIHEK